MIEILKNTALEIFTKIRSYQEYLHRHPELSFSESATAAFITEKLSELGLTADAQYARHSVVALIRGNHPDANHAWAIGLRADIDALPITEDGSHDICSANPGVMHACGYDLHTASLLGTAEILVKHRELLQGDALLIFQPAEEKLPGGAKTMIDNGLLRDYRIRAILGQHVQPGLKTGSFGFCPGSYMASTDEIYIDFTGRGGHAATPDITANTVMALSDFISLSQIEFKKMAGDQIPAVLAFGKLQAAGATNIIPDVASAAGTMRCFDEALRKSVKEMLHRLAGQIANPYKTMAGLNIVDGYPVLVNHENLTNDLIKAAKQFADNDNILNLDRRLTAEDFAYYTQQVPSVFYRMGIAGNGKGETNLHNASFDSDPESMLHSMGMMAWLAISSLNSL